MPSIDKSQVEKVARLTIEADDAFRDMLGEKRDDIYVRNCRTRQIVKAIADACGVPVVTREHEDRGTGRKYYEYNADAFGVDFFAMDWGV